MLVTGVRKPKSKERKKKKNTSNPPYPDLTILTFLFLLQYVLSSVVVYAE